LKESKAKGEKTNRIFGTDLLGLSMCIALSITIVDQEVLLSNPKEIYDLNPSDPSIWPPTIFGPKNPLFSHLVFLSFLGFEDPT